MLKYLLGLTVVFASRISSNSHTTLDLCSADNEYCTVFPKNSTYLNATMDTFEEVLYTANSSKVLFYGDVMTSLHWYLLSKSDNLIKIHAADKELQQHLNMDHRTPFSMIHVKISENGNYYYETYSWNIKTWSPSRMFEIFLKAESESLIPEYLPVHQEKRNAVLNLTHFHENAFIHPLKIWVVLYYTNENDEDVQEIAKSFNILQQNLGKNVELYCHDLGTKKPSITLKRVPSVVLYSSFHKETQSYIELMPPFYIGAIARFIDSNVNLKLKELNIEDEKDVDRVLEEYK